MSVVTSGKCEGITFTTYPGLYEKIVEIAKEYNSKVVGFEKKMEDRLVDNDGSEDLWLKDHTVNIRLRSYSEPKREV